MEFALRVLYMRGGVNYVLFNGEDADCTDVGVVRIDQVTIHSSVRK